MEYKKMDYLGFTIDSVVEKLLDYKKNNELVSTEFNGVILYSDKVTIDNAYKEITGRTKTEFDKKMQERREEIERKNKEHKEKIPELITTWQKKGREILEKDKWEKWDEIVPIRLKDLYKGMELGNTLEIAEILNNDGSFEEAKEVFENQSHSGNSFHLVCNMVREFCSKGNDFIEYL